MIYPMNSPQSGDMSGKDQHYEHTTGQGEDGVAGGDAPSAAEHPSRPATSLFAASEVGPRHPESSRPIDAASATTRDQRAKTIGIVGNYGNDNAGDEAILMGLLSQLRAEDPSVKIVVFSMNPTQSQRAHGAQCFPAQWSVREQREPGAPAGDASPQTSASRGLLHSLKMWLRRHRRARTLRRCLVYMDTALMHPRFWGQTFSRLRNIDLLLIGGGNLLMDLFDRMPPLYTMYAVLARLSRAKVMYYGVGAGPISSLPGKLCIKTGTACAQYVTVRDAESAAVLEGLRIKPPVAIAADPALGISCERIPTQLSSLQLGIADGAPLIGVSVIPFRDPRYWPDPDRQKYQDYLERMARVVDSIASEFSHQVVMLHTKFPADMHAAQDVRGRLAHADSVIILDESVGPLELIGVMKSLTCVVGTRLHSLILATAMGVPVVAIAYQRKVSSFMNRLGQADMVIGLEEMTPELVTARMRHLFGEYEARRARLRRETSRLQLEARKSAIIALDILAGNGGGM